MFSLLLHLTSLPEGRSVSFQFHFHRNCPSPSIQFQSFLNMFKNGPPSLDSDRLEGILGQLLDGWQLEGDVIGRNIALQISSIGLRSRWQGGSRSTVCPACLVTWSMRYRGSVFYCFTSVSSSSFWKFSPYCMLLRLNHACKI